MDTRAGKILAAVMALSFAGPVGSVRAQELSEKAVNSFMDYAWSLTPQQFSKPDGKTIVIDKSKRDPVMVPIDTAREVIKVGRLSAHAQVCNLQDDQARNHHAMMRREEAKKKWSDQQLVYISQLHLTTVMLLTGKIRLVEKDGDKVVFLDDDKKDEKPQTCTQEQAAKVKELIEAYVASSPPPKTAAAPADQGGAAAAPKAEAAAAPAAAPAKAASTTTGSTTAPAAQAPAAKPAAGAAPPAAAPAAAPAAPPKK